MKGNLNFNNPIVLVIIGIVIGMFIVPMLFGTQSTPSGNYNYYDVVNFKDTNSNFVGSLDVGDYTTICDRNLGYPSDVDCYVEDAGWESISYLDGQDIGVFYGSCRCFERLR